MKFFLTYITLATVLIFSPVSHSASACKGLSIEKCQTNKSCSWIKSFQRKDGKNTKAYCRSKPSKKIIKKSIDDTLKKTKASSKSATNSGE